MNIQLLKCYWLKLYAHGRRITYNELTDYQLLKQDYNTFSIDPMILEILTTRSILKDILVRLKSVFILLMDSHVKSVKLPFYSIYYRNGEQDNMERRLVL